MICFSPTILIKVLPKKWQYKLMHCHCEEQGCRDGDNQKNCNKESSQHHEFRHTRETNSEKRSSEKLRMMVKKNN